MEYREELIDLLKIIVDSSDWDNETSTFAQALSMNLTDFEFNFLLNIFGSIFSYTNVIFDVL